MNRLSLFFVALLTMACGLEPEQGPGPDEPVVQAHRALGVPKDGFPNWEERVVLVLTNRARADPAAQSAETCGGGCASYPSTKPLTHHHDLARAARFHATSLKKAGSGLQHESICRLVSNLGAIYPGTCDGDPSCACEGGAASCSCSGGKPYCSCAGGACTSTWGRIGLFGVSGRGENAAAGSSDPIKTFSQWVKSSGHWKIVNTSSNSSLGVGHYGGPGKGCYSHFWVQVYGSGGTTAPLAAGAHYPQGGKPGTQVKFWANFHDPAGPPKAATVNLGGTCFPMKLERGTPGSGTYLYTHPFQAASCHRYYFMFTTQGGQRVTFPTSGSYGVDISAPNACLDHTDKIRPLPGKGCGGCVSASECPDSDPCTQDTCVSGKCLHKKITGCCAKDAQCNDKNSCTVDRCDAKTRRCTFQKTPACGDAKIAKGDTGSGNKPGLDSSDPVGQAEGGCALAGSGGSPPWYLLLLVLWRRRRH